MLSEYLSVLTKLPEPEKALAAKDILAATKAIRIVPNEGPQTDAALSDADVLLFGGCVSGDTEYLSESGWKRIDQYDGGRVAQWAESGALTFVKPDGYTDTPCDELIHFKNEHRLSMMLSPEHRMPLYDWTGKFVVKPASRIEARPSKHTVPVTFHVDRPGLPYSETMLRLAVAIHADGNLYIKKNSTAHCRISVRKERKKERLISFLTELSIPWHEYRNPNRPTEVRYGFVSPITTKTYAGDWWQASQEQLAIILDEMSYWDGCIAGAQGGDIAFNTAREPDAHFMQYAAHACGRVATIGKQAKVGLHNVIYRVNISRAGSVKCTVTLRVDAVDISRVKADRMYCFTVPTSFWLARHDGCIFVTGNSPGGGKSVLEILLAVNDHYRSLIVRKNFTDLDGLIDTAKKLLGGDEGFVGGSRPKYRKPDGGVIHFAGLSGDGGIGGHQGVDHDLICVDEAAQIPENQVRLLMGWLRTDRPGQRCRVVLGSNPPLDSVGDWLLECFAPWLNSTHSNPAMPGELRWFLPTEEGKDVECKKGDSMLIDGVKVYAQSRTFIPSKFTDNPFYDPEKYAATLAALPKEQRGILVSGNFMMSRLADPWQVIPTDWIRAAQERWTPMPPQGIPLCAIGVDVAQGGDDSSVLAPRYDAYFAKPISVPGKQTPKGSDVAGLVFSHLRDNATVIVDLGGGYGSGPLELLSDNGVETVGYKGAESTSQRTSDGKMGFTNVRSAAYWSFREALNPDQPGGSPVALPDDTELVADLTAPQYRTTPHGYQITPKEEVVKKLGRSPDKGDAVIMSWWKGNRRANMQGGKFKRKREISVNLGQRQSAMRRH